ncbi:hypothetical protein, partial [Pseudomonas coronafaciens]|uniref:hypothetical protein n=1 Tax=Pseudomonas coronafaciens TaxID=53409 RepID=UPI00399BA227
LLALSELLRRIDLGGLSVPGRRDARVAFCVTAPLEGGCELEVFVVLGGLAAACRGVLDF